MEISQNSCGQAELASIPEESLASTGLSLNGASPSLKSLQTRSPARLSSAVGVNRDSYREAVEHTCLSDDTGLLCCNGDVSRVRPDNAGCERHIQQKSTCADSDSYADSDSELEDILGRPSRALLVLERFQTGRRSSTHSLGSRLGTFGLPRRSLARGRTDVDDDVDGELAPAFELSCRRTHQSTYIQRKIVSAQQKWRGEEKMFLESRARRSGTNTDAFDPQMASEAACQSLYQGPPGINTWKAIIDGRLITSEALRDRLSDQWTVIGVVTALVANWAIGGVNSAQGILVG